jgi:hypothetical protein
MSLPSFLSTTLFQVKAPKKTCHKFKFSFTNNARSISRERREERVPVVAGSVQGRRALGRGGCGLWRHLASVAGSAPLELPGPREQGSCKIGVAGGVPTPRGESPTHLVLSRPPDASPFPSPAAFSRGSPLILRPRVVGHVALASAGTSDRS